MFRNLKLKSRMLIVICSVVFIALTLTIAFIAVKSGNIAKKSALDKSVETAYRYSSSVKSKIDNAVDSVMILAQSIEGIKKSNIRPEPVLLDNLVKEVLDKNNNFHGIWVMIDPGTMYEKDLYYSWFYREDNNIVADDSFTQEQYQGYTENDYYSIPKKFKKEVVIEPYTDESLNILMTSACAPVMDNGNCIGVVGIDITLEDISKMLIDIRPFETGNAFVVSNNAQYVGHTDKENIGRNMLEALKFDINKDEGNTRYKKWKNAVNAVKSGSLFTMNDYSEDLKTEVHSIFVPIQISSSDNFWSFVINVPMNQVLKDTYKITLYCIIVGFIAMLITASAIAVFSGTIIRPIKNAIKQIGNIAKGDLTLRLAVENNDEIGELAVEFNQFVESLEKIIKQINKQSMIMDSSSDQLLGVAYHLSNSIDQTSEMAGHVSGSVKNMGNNLNNISSTMEEFSANISMAASMAEEMASTINEITQNSGKSKNISDNAVVQSKKTAEKMAELGSAAQEIGKIVESITEISAQTNLLALNATIEAARAGESGKGFAVVAGEIKNLAKQTSDATLIIKQQVQNIQSTTASTLIEINQISEVINDVNNIASTIAVSVSEQASATTEIAKNISQTALEIENVNSTINSTNLSAENIKADIEKVNMQAQEMNNNNKKINLNAKELKNMSEKLNIVVREFKVN